MRGPTRSEPPVKFGEVKITDDERAAISEYLDDPRYSGPRGYAAVEQILIREIHRRDGVAWDDFVDLCLAIGLAIDGKPHTQKLVWGLMTDNYPGQEEPRPRAALELTVDDEHRAVDDLV
ncbi:hypothetical protein [Natronomonas amylolytica]|uniref:hypothetical protein n=1 Tax=Natronomonas amylolytica TaxID=3108498 RepID=UPI00300B5CF5